MSVFRNSFVPDGLRLSQLYRWRKECGGTTAILPSLNNVSCAGLMPEAETLKRYGCVSVLAVPVFNDSGFWGFTFFEKFKEEIFSEYETS